MSKSTASRAHTLTWTAKEVIRCHVTVHVSEGMGKRRRIGNYFFLSPHDSLFFSLPTNPLLIFISFPRFHFIGAKVMEMKWKWKFCRICSRRDSIFSSAILFFRGSILVAIHAFFRGSIFSRICSRRERNRNRVLLAGNIFFPASRC